MHPWSQSTHALSSHQMPWIGFWLWKSGLFPRSLHLLMSHFRAIPIHFPPIQHTHRCMHTFPAPNSCAGTPYKQCAHTLRLCWPAPIPTEIVSLRDGPALSTLSQKANILLASQTGSVDELQITLIRCHQRRSDEDHSLTYSPRQIFKFSDALLEIVK